MYTFVRRHDRDSDGRLLFSDFCDAFTPQDPYYANSLATRQAQFIYRNIAREHFFAPQTRETFFRCFKVLFEVEESLELHKKRVARRPKFNTRDAFKHLDMFDVEYLSKESLKICLHNNSFYPTERELSWLANRFDSNRNGRINY